MMFSFEILFRLVILFSDCLWIIVIGSSTSEGSKPINIGRRSACRNLLIEVECDNETNFPGIQVKTAVRGSVNICEVAIRTSSNMRLRAMINLKQFSQTPFNCNRAYLNIGNDYYGAYVQTMTSYRLCNQSETEIVSRGNNLWIVQGSTRENRIFAHVLVEVQKKVSCTTTEFECSPVQCVPWTKVCDGNIDCRNGRDEYCANTSSIETEPCFRCKDATCIRPRLPRYHIDWGKPMWFMCDGTRHCSDGTDERIDVCIRRGGITEKVIACHPVSVPASHLVSTQLMWRKDVECNNIQDCHGNEDEDHCREAAATETSHRTSILIVTVALCIVVAGAFVIHRQFGKQDKIHRDTSSEEMDTTCQHPRVKQKHFTKHQLPNIREETECFISTV